MAMLMKVKAKSFEKKGLLTADEFKAIAEGVLAEGGAGAGARQRVAQPIAQQSRQDS